MAKTAAGYSGTISGSTGSNAGVAVFTPDAEQPPGPVIAPAGNGSLYFPKGLRRWRAAYALADQQIVPVVFLGDSIVFGVGADNTTSTANTSAAVLGYVGRLRAKIGLDPFSPGVTGEGFIFADDSRVTAAGSPVQNGWACSAQGHGYRLIGGTQTLTFTVPAGVTSVGVIQGNTSAAFNSGGSGLADVTGLYNINGGANTGMTALTGTNLPLVTSVAVAAGNTFQVVGPASAQTYVSGFLLNNSATTGVQPHRIGVSGQVIGKLLGGQTSGTLDKGSANQVIAAQACYRWAATPGLLVVSFMLNDQQFSLGGGSASQNNVTLARFTAWATQFAVQGVADGWCVLFLAIMRNPGYTGDATLSQYAGALKGIAAANDHMSFMDAGEVWGNYAASQADGVQVTGSEHPNKAGCGDIANMLLAALRGETPNGITELTPG